MRPIHPRVMLLTITTVSSKDPGTLLVLGELECQMILMVRTLGAPG